MLLLAMVWLSPAARAAEVPLPRPRPKIVVPNEPRSFAEAVAGLNLDPASVTDAPTRCQTDLEAIALIEPLPRLIGPGQCGGPDMIRMRTIILRDRSQVSINPPLTLRCGMAGAFAHFVRDELTTILRAGGRGLRSIDGTGSYECRGRNRIVGAKVSEHGMGNAIDIHSLTFTDGSALYPTDLLADKALRETLKEAACGRFTTVLGPGSDGYHEEHVHLDLAERRGAYKMCQWDVKVPGAISGEVPLPRPRPAGLGERAGPASAGEATEPDAEEVEDTDEGDASEAP
jgi:hypothetical protein